VIRRIAGEFLGTAFLLAIVVGSGIMGERLAGGNAAIALLANALATGAGLVALILAFGPISGAHLNPVVTLTEAVLGRLEIGSAIPYVAAQVIGAMAGVVAAHGMFDLPLFQTSAHIRTGYSQWWAEFVATFGLLTVILQCARSRPEATPFAVGAYITAAYWFTASTSFANPAVTVARSFTDTFSGIRPQDAPGFIVAQLVGATAAVLAFRWFAATPRISHEQPAAVFPRRSNEQLKDGGR
jgi:glycerol uptake facilitator-like aquaporin